MPGGRRLSCRMVGLAYVVAEFATETTIDEAAVRVFLEQPSAGPQLVDAATRYGY